MFIHVVVQSSRRVRYFVILWTSAHQVSLSLTIVPQIPFILTNSDIVVIREVRLSEWGNTLSPPLSASR